MKGGNRMVWVIIVIILLVFGLGQEWFTAPQKPLSPMPTEYAKKMSNICQTWMRMHYGFSRNYRYFMKYAYLYIYVKQGRRNATDEQNCFVRKVIWEFKEGKYDAELVYRIALLIKKVVGEPLGSKVLICIPASTNVRNVKRFEEFSKEVCSLTGMQNGFGRVTIKSERRQSHLSADRSIPEWEDIVEMREQKVRGHSVVLIDDVLTTGNSYGSFKEYLESKGARVYCGIFISTVPENE